MVLFVAHAEDPDGIIARALLMRYFMTTESNPENHVLVRYDRIVRSFQEAQRKAEHHKSIFIADVDVNGRLYGAATASSLFERLAEGRNVFWFDHHEGTEPRKHGQELTDAGINVFYQENQCAAMLIAQHLHVTDPYDRRLARIAQAHDYQKFAKPKQARNIQIGNELEKVIAVANENLNDDLLLKLSCDLAEQKCFDRRYDLRPAWKVYADDFDARAPAALKELDESVEISKVGKHTVLFGYCPALLSQKNGPRHLLQK